MAQESPLLETSLIALIHILVDKIEPTHIEPSIEEEPPIDERLTIAKVPIAMTKFT